MDVKTCYYCGTKYPLDVDCCPLCGQTEIEPEAIDEAPVEIKETFEPDQQAVKDRADQRQKRVNVLSTIICILLGIAVVAGVLFILNSLDVISFQKKPAEEGSLTLPVEGADTPVVPDAVPCTGVDLQPGTAAFNTVGSTLELIVAVQPAGCTDTFSFLSSDEAVATVSEQGVVTCVGNGTAEITVTCGEFAKSMEVICTIEEETGEIDGPDTNEMDPVLSTEDFSLFEAGETATIRVNGIAEDTAVEWSTSNAAVATVENGKVTAVSAGTVTISAKIGDVTLKCIVRCKLPEGAVVPPQSNPSSNETTDDGTIFLSHDDVTIQMGESFVIRLVQNDARLSGVSWTSSDMQVCTVEQNGTVVGRGPGIATVVGTYNAMTYQCIVRCS